MYEFNKLIPNLSYEQYADAEGLRAGYLHDLRRSAMHMDYYLKNPLKVTKALNFGKVFHAAVESPQRLREVLIVEPEFTGKTKDGRESAQSGEARAKKAAWYASLPKDAEVVTRDEETRLMGMLKALQDHKMACKILERGTREVCAWTKDPETGEVLKFRADFISEDNFLVDLKSTRDAHPSFFYHQMLSDRYPDNPFYALSAAHYTHIARVAGLCDPDNFLFIAVESEPPHAVNIFGLNHAHLEATDKRYRAPLTRLYAKCRKENKWPGYEEKIIEPDLPRWALEYGDIDLSHLEP
jgi:hypothetical protein